MKRLLALLLTALCCCCAALAAATPDEDEIIEYACLIAAAPCVEVDVSAAYWDEVFADDALERCDALCVDDEDEMVFACAFRYDHRVMSIVTAAWRPDGPWLGADGVSERLTQAEQEQLCLQCRGWVELVCPGAVAAATYERVLDVQDVDGQPCYLVAFYVEESGEPCTQAAVLLQPAFRVLMLDRAWE